jgi:hypothetical protein
MGKSKESLFFCHESIAPLDTISVLPMNFGQFAVRATPVVCADRMMPHTRDRPTLPLSLFTSEQENDKIHMYSTSDISLSDSDLKRSRPKCWILEFASDFRY